MNKRDLQKLVNLLKRHKGNRAAAAKVARPKMAYSTFCRRIEEARELGIEVPEFISSKEAAASRTTSLTDDELHAAWAVYERYGYNASDSGEAVGLNHKQMSLRVRLAVERFNYQKKHLGSLRASQAKQMPLPSKGTVARYFLTSLQNNTKLHDATWASGIELAKYYDADIMVGTFTYVGGDGSEKRGKESDREAHGWKIDDRWYDPRIMPYISDEYVQLAPGLVWCGQSNILPTRSDPLRGKENINGRNSGIYPHPRIEMRPVATTQSEGTKFNYTTGTIGLRNYLQKDAGITAEFYHCFGFLLVEVNDKGEWWCRQLNADSEGTIYDLDVYATPKGVFESDGVEALVFGDTHVRNVDEKIRDATWGEGGMVPTLNPKLQVSHDILDFESRSHHNRRDPHTMYALHRRGRDNVWDELREVGEFLEMMQESAPKSKLYVIDSNHDRHFDRWLKEADWRNDLPNARTILRANEAMLAAIDAGEEDEFVPLEWALHEMGYGERVFFTNLRSEIEDKLSLVVCPDSGGGIELALHGDVGPNGARGSPRNLSKLGRKNVIGHGHSPGIWGGTYVAGVTGKLRQGYNVGPSSWAHAHVVIYPNGKRQVLLFWHGKWRA